MSSGYTFPKNSFSFLLFCTSSAVLGFSYENVLRVARPQMPKMVMDGPSQASLMITKQLNHSTPSLFKSQNEVSPVTANSQLQGIINSCHPTLLTLKLMMKHSPNAHFSQIPVIACASNENKNSTPIVIS